MASFRQVVENRVLHRLSPGVVYIIHLIRTNGQPQQKGATTIWRLGVPKDCYVTGVERDRYLFATVAVSSPNRTHASVLIVENFGSVVICVQI